MATNKARCNFPLYFGSSSYRAVLSNAIQRCLKVSGCSFELIRNRLLSIWEKPEIPNREILLYTISMEEEEEEEMEKSNTQSLFTLLCHPSDRQLTN